MLPWATLQLRKFNSRTTFSPLLIRFARVFDIKNALTAHARGQIVNEAAKIRYRSGGTFNCGGLTIRTPTMSVVRHLGFRHLDISWVESCILGPWWHIPLTISRRLLYGCFRAKGSHKVHMQLLTYAYFVDLKIVIPRSPIQAKGLLLSSIRDQNPVIFMEPKVLYRSAGNSAFYPFFM